MSMESQGPGWWLASDGKWYPPQDSTPAVPPPPQGVPSFSGQPMPGQPMQGGYAGGPPPAKSNNKGCIYALVAVGILALLGAGGCSFLLFVAKDKVETAVDEMTVREGVGSVDEPAPVGTAVDIGDGWEFQVVDADLDATDKIVANSEFSKPAAGKKFVIVTFKGTYSGTSSADMLTQPELIGESKVASDPSFACELPDDVPALDTFVTAEAGAEVEGSLCFEVDADEKELRAKFEQFFNAPAYFELE